MCQKHLTLILSQNSVKLSKPTVTSVMLDSHGNFLELPKLIILATGHVQHGTSLTFIRPKRQW